MILAIKQWFTKPRKVWWPISNRPNFTNESANTRWARATLYSPEGKQLQAYLLEGILTERFYPGDRYTQEQAAMEFARIQGGLEVFRRLQDCAKEPPKAKEPLEPTYLQDNPDDDLEDQ